MDMPWTAPPADQMRFNPLVAHTTTPSDGRLLVACCLQAGQVLAAAVRGHRPARARRPTPRFADHASLLANSAEAHGDPRRGVRRRARSAEWREALADFVGQWAVVQDTLEAAADPQIGGQRLPAGAARPPAARPFQLVAAPVQFDEVPPRAGRAPEFNEHGDEILAELGLDWDAIIDLKVRGVVA